MLIIISNGHAYGPFNDVTSATSYAKHHLLGTCWRIVNMISV